MLFLDIQNYHEPHSECCHKYQMIFASTPPPLQKKFFVCLLNARNMLVVLSKLVPLFEERMSQRTIVIHK